ncbi:MAG TPA: right-handed parallel beta-helix repeat-containing protein [Conexibacter sp.]
MDRSSRLIKGGTAALVTVTALGSVFAASAGAQTTHMGKGKAAGNDKTRFVSPRGKDAWSCTKAQPCKTITDAIAKSGNGGKVVVGPGTYREDVRVTKDVTLTGRGNPVVNARGLDNGIVVMGARAAGATVHGFTVRDATFEGLLVRNATRVTISGNTVAHNDLGRTAARPVGFCSPMGGGDCGEGIHLLGTTHSTIVNNTSTGNAGGMLVSDETGPSAFNTISGNTIMDNPWACGITLAGHNPRAIVLGGTADAPVEMSRAKNVAGVYDNVVTNNTVERNGLRSAGGGVMIATGLPGGGVYDNTVKGNTANGNGFGGVTLHSHVAGQDLNGNKIVDNTLSNDGVFGFPQTGAPGDQDAGITDTVGITVFSAVTPLQGTVVSGNKISNVHFGVWTQNVPTIDPDANRTNATVAVPLFQK